ncbi:MAG: hypothetical protein EAZ55_09250 [Cytophagales bacterium]|nr:MAG: hypothetical protein EAZ55_09250 [Cytophagales bacterium]
MMVFVSNNSNASNRKLCILFCPFLVPEISVWEIVYCFFFHVIVLAGKIKKVANAKNQQDKKCLKFVTLGFLFTFAYDNYINLK